MRRLVAVAMLASLALAGCSDPGGDGDPPTTSDSGSPSASVSVSLSATDSSSSSSTSASPTPSAEPRPAQVFDIDIEGNDFVDGSLTVQRGDTVRWTQRDLAQHTVTQDDGAFDSGTMTVLSAPFEVTFDEAGDFPYHCDIHASMTDTITVVAALPA